jgi:hypothetical protein
MSRRRRRASTTNSRASPSLPLFPAVPLILRLVINNSPNGLYHNRRRREQLNVFVDLSIHCNPSRPTTTTATTTARGRAGTVADTDALHAPAVIALPQTYSPPSATPSQSQTACGTHKYASTSRTLRKHACRAPPRAAKSSCVARACSSATPCASFRRPTDRFYLCLLLNPSLSFGVRGRGRAAGRGFRRLYGTCDAPRSPVARVALEPGNTTCRPCS